MKIILENEQDATIFSALKMAGEMSHCLQKLSDAAKRISADNPDRKRRALISAFNQDNDNAFTLMIDAFLFCGEWVGRNATVENSP